MMALATVAIGEEVAAAPSDEVSARIFAAHDHRVRVARNGWPKYAVAQPRRAGERRLGGDRRQPGNVDRHNDHIGLRGRRRQFVRKMVPRELKHPLQCRRQRLVRCFQISAELKLVPAGSWKCRVYRSSIFA